jgi:hypothetical protein
MTHRSVIAVVVLCALSPLTARAQFPWLADQDFSGCYALEIGEWNPPLQGDRGLHNLPHAVRLDTTLASRGGRVLTPDISYPHPHRFPGVPYWTIRGDTIRLVWSNGFTPTIVWLTKVDDVLKGYAQAQRDAIPPGKPNWPRASIIARRTKCKT